MLNKKINKQTVSDIILKNDIRTWTTDKPITITAGTGVGKSYFIKNTLYQYAKENNKKILMLIHRSNCVDQFTEELQREYKDDTITVMSYQLIDFVEHKNINSFNFRQYSYIVCDEFHYFISDSLFNDNTHLSFNAIMEQENTIKVFMSATGNHMLDYINNVRQIETVDYKIDIDYSFIDKLHFYNNDIWLNKILSKSKKAIVFMQSAEKAYEYYNKYREISIYNCSKGNVLYKHVDEKQINTILFNERFDANYLFTTSVMDSGVNIIDNQLDTIIIDGIIDINIIKQCIGRKRILNDEKINIYIRSMSGKRFGGIQTSLNNTIKEHDTSTFKYYKSLIDNKAIETIKDESFYIYVARALDKEYDFIDLEKYELICYLESNCNNLLDKETQNELINFINYRKDGKLKKSIKNINEYFNINNLNYKLTSRRVTINSIKKTYWKLNRTKNGV